MTTTMRSVLIVSIVALLAGCAVGPDYHRPGVDLPDSAFETTLLDKKQEQAMASWWTRYNDPTLNRLIDQALTSNLDIAMQAQKVRQARAELGYQNAQFFPTIEGQAEGMRQAAGKNIPASSGGGGDHTSHFSTFSVAGSLSYELDLWGALRRADESARAQLLSSAYTKDSIRLQTVADVVANYMSLLALEQQIRVTQETIESRQKGLDLDQKRYQYGAIDKLTLLQTKSQLDNARAQLPPLQQNAAKLRTSLAILTGQTPREIMQQAKLPEDSFDDMKLPENLPLVLPSSLLNRRPDIRAAEAALIAANANVGVAKAKFFPTINLSAMIGTEALHIGDLFGPGTALRQAGGSITGPILDFGRINAQYESAKAQKAQAEIAYRQTVRQAFKDVRNALDEVKYSQKTYKAVDEQVTSAAETLQLAKLRYNVGQTDYFDVLDAQRNLFASQLELANAIRDRFTAVADLYKALGGGWTEDSDSLTPEMQRTIDSYKSGNEKGGAGQEEE